MHLASQLVNFSAHLELDSLIAFYNLLEKGHKFGFLRLQLPLKDSLHTSLTVDHFSHLLLYTPSSHRLSSLLACSCSQARPANRRSRCLAPLQTVAVLLHLEGATLLLPGDRSLVLLLLLRHR